MSKWTQRDRLMASNHFDMEEAAKEREVSNHDSPPLVIRSFGANRPFNTVLAEQLKKVVKQC